ncbi:hypothetical protein [Methanoculleus chikugoensis]|uniref:hypothetical protein n=1 Tax=Methanoculleus chikugoensis TaxID=118126 RepID=UPI001FB36B09|nr:hypothetical protein [Methanoculleus chikugoensis]
MVRTLADLEAGAAPPALRLAGEGRPAAVPRHPPRGGRDPRRRRRAHCISEWATSSGRSTGS